MSTTTMASEQVKVSSTESVTTPHSPRGSRVLCLLLAGIIAFLPAIPHIRWTAVNRMDDYLITLRYARNAASGIGAVYNEGDRVQGFTSSLQFLTGYSLSSVGFGQEALPATICLIGLLSIVVVGANISFWCNRRLSYIGIFVAVCLLLTSKILTDFIGFDSVWAAAFVATGLSMLSLRAPRAAGFAFGFAVLSRPDTALLVIVVGVAYVFKHDWRNLIAFGLPVLAITLPWYIWAGLYYGSPIPNTLGVKMIQGRLEMGETYRPLRFVARTLMGNLHLGDGSPRDVFLLLVLTSLIGWEWAYRDRKKSTHRPCVSHTSRIFANSLLFFGLFAVLQCVSYLFLLRVPPYPWYLVYIIAFLLAAVGSGAIWLAGHGEYVFVEYLRRRQGLKRRLLPIGVALAPVILTGYLCANTASRDTVRKNPGRHRYAGYHAAARWMTEHASPSDIVRVGELGVFGWYYPNAIEDDMELVHEPIPLDLSSFRYAVMMAPRNADNVRFVENCVEAARFPANEVSDVVIYKRR